MLKAPGGYVGDLVKKTFVVVLAGGKGSRLRELGLPQAKPSLPFGGCNRLIDFPLSNCLNSGLRRIAVATQFSARELHRHLQQHWAFLHHQLDEFVEIWPAQQSKDNNDWYKGTADAVFQNLDSIWAHGADHVLILAGDHVYRQDYGALLSHHVQADADVTISCIEVPGDHAHHFGIVSTDKDNLVTGFAEKPEKGTIGRNPANICIASMGIYVFRMQFLADLLHQNSLNPGSSHDFGHDILPNLIGDARVVAHQFGDSCVRSHPLDQPYWRDVGTLDAYWRANLDLNNAHPPLDLLDAKWPIQAKLGHTSAARIDAGTNGCVSRTVVAPGVIINQATVEDSVLSQTVHVDANSHIEQSVLLPGVVIGPSVRLRRVIVGEGCHLPTGMVVGENADEDACWFSRSEKGITLITAQALERWKISQKLKSAKPTVAVVKPSILGVPSTATAQSFSDKEVVSQTLATGSP